jgi:Co/Zn/Cd efflux system component
MNSLDSAATKTSHGALRKVVGVVALLNFTYSDVELALATVIGSVSLFADSADFCEDAAVNLLIFTALAWNA